MKITNRVAQTLRNVREHPLEPETGRAVAPLSQQVLAKKLKSVPSTLSQYEATDEREPRRKAPLDVIERWAEACGYRLILELVPAVSAEVLLRKVESASPEKRALVSQFMQVVEQQPPEVLRTLRTVLQALGPTVGQPLEPPSSAPLEESPALRSEQGREDAP